VKRHWFVGKKNEKKQGEAKAPSECCALKEKNEPKLVLMCWPALDRYNTMDGWMGRQQGAGGE
jgi:hypothetical protein